MNSTQRKIAVATLLFNALFFHVIFCNWQRNYVGSQFYEINRRLIVSTKIRFSTHTRISRGEPLSDVEYSWGINARSADTYAVDAILGIAFPITLGAIAICICAGSVKRKPPSLDVTNSNKT